MNETMDQILRRVTGRDSGRGPASRASNRLLQEDWNKAQREGHRGLVYLDDGPARKLITIGAQMESETEMLRAATYEAGQAKELLEQTFNDLCKLSTTIASSLEKTISATRAARMAVVGEMRESLQALKDVRQFFLESDYKTEMDRMERFIRVCNDILELKRNGSLDAVSDLALKLAVGNGNRGGT